MNLRMIFCKHQYGEYWQSYFEGADVTFKRVCQKCGKRIQFQMPIDNVKSAYEHYIYLKKQMKL